MKEYRILHDYAGKELEKEVNELAAQGFVIDKVLQQSDNGTYICIIMVRDQEVQTQKQKVKDLLSSYGNYFEKAITGDLTDEELEELNDEVLGRIKSVYGDYDK